MESAVLPALSLFDTVVDLRFRFERDNIKDLVAVAIVHIDTDVSNRELWFQMGRSDVEHILKQLSDVLKQIETSEKLLGQAVAEGKQ